MADIQAWIDAHTGTEIPLQPARAAQMKPEAQ